MKADLSPLELEEAVQDVCIKLQTRKVLAQLRAASTPRGYLVRMLRNAAIDRLRQDVRGLRRFERDLPLADTVGCYSLGAAPSDTALPDAVAQLLSDEERALFRECYVLRRPIGEIAASRGISPSAANGRLRRLRERLRAMKDGSHMRKRKTRKRNVNLERLRAAGEANGVPWGVSWNQIAERAKVEHSRSPGCGRRAVPRERCGPSLLSVLQVPSTFRLNGWRENGMTCPTYQSGSTRTAHHCGSDPRRITSAIAGSCSASKRHFAGILTHGTGPKPTMNTIRGDAEWWERSGDWPYRRCGDPPLSNPCGKRVGPACGIATTNRRSHG